MKRILLALLLLVSVNSFSQDASYYTAYKTQLFQSFTGQSSWTSVTEPTLVDIPITLKGNLLIINAKSPTSFTYYESTQENVKGDGYYGKRFRAKEHSNNQSCFISIINYVNTDYVTLQVAYLDENPQFLLVYYILKN